MAEDQVAVQQEGTRTVLRLLSLGVRAATVACGLLGMYICFLFMLDLSISEDLFVSFILLSAPVMCGLGMQQWRVGKKLGAVFLCLWSLYLVCQVILHLHTV